MRLLVLTHGGIECALQHLLALDCAEVAAIFVETGTVRRAGFAEKLRRSVRYDGYLATAAKAVRMIPRHRSRAPRLDNPLKAVETLAAASGIPLHYVANYHSAEAIEQMRAVNVDLGVVLGTNILKESVFRIPRLGSINVHQGLAPYYRGCPAVFWELFNDEKEVGLTIHFVESKVDTGGIVAQETVPLNYDYAYGLDFDAFIEAYREGLKGRCAALLAGAVRSLALGTARITHQNLLLGKRYRLPVKREKDEMRRRLRERRRRLPAHGPTREVAGEQG